MVVEEDPHTLLSRKTSDGNSFWSLSARNSVQSITTEDTVSESPRRILQKKRSSLSHQPETARALEKKLSQETGVHEFQKVMTGLKRVEAQPKKLSSADNLDQSQADSKEGDEEVSGDKNSARNGNESIPGERNSSDKKDASDLNSKAREDKCSAPAGAKKKQTTRSGGKTQSKPGPSQAQPSASSRKQPLKPRHSAPARTSSVGNTKKETSSTVPPVKSSATQKKVKPDTIATQKNPTRSRSSSPKAKLESKPAGKTLKGPVTRTMSLKSKPSQGKLETSDSSTGTRSSSLRRQNSKTVGGTDVKKTPPPVPPKPRSEPLKKNTDKTPPSSEVKKVAPPVAPKPGTKRFSIPNNSKDVVRPTKLSPAKKEKRKVSELAKLADSQALEIVVQETLHQTQFVSQAQTTLSPATPRRNRPAAAGTEETDAGPEEEEAGIISESVSASSVIQMFGGVGRFKKTANSATSSPSSEKALSLGEESRKDPEIKSAQPADEKTVRRQSSTTSVTSKASNSSTTRKASNTSVSRKASNTSVSRKASNTSSRKDSNSSVPRKDSSTSISRKDSNSSRKTSSETSGARSSVGSQRRKSSSTLATRNRSEESSCNVVKTTMTVRLHPGNSRKLSKDKGTPEDEKEFMAEVKEEEDENLDIKLISGEQEEKEVLENQEERVEEDVEEIDLEVPVKGSSNETISGGSLEVSGCPDKTRQ